MARVQTGRGQVNPVEEAAHNPQLRTKTERVERLYTLVKDRMIRMQKGWGQDLSVLDDPEIARMPLVLRRARAVEKTLLEMPITIEDEDIVVGATIDEGVVVRTQLPRYSTDQERDEAQKNDGKVEVGLAHKTPNYPDLMERGFSGIIADIERKLAEIKARPASVDKNEKTAFFEAMRIECQAVVKLAHRYSDLAERLAAKATPRRRVDLLKIAKVCRRVPEFSPETLHEAVQAFWLTHYAFFSTRTGLACGRIDQFLYPAFKNQMDEGTITLSEAQELVDCLWLRFNDRAQICRENFASENDNDDDWRKMKDRNAVMKSLQSFETRSIHKAAGQTSIPRVWEAGHRKRIFSAIDGVDAVNHWGQNVLLSGIRPDGTDGTNKLTYLFLNAGEKFALTSPVHTARLHKNSPEILVRRVAEVLKSGGGMPYIDNDDVIVKAYMDLGVPAEDARDYSNSNCWETMIQGKADQEMIRGINFLLLLELALNRGFSPVYGEQMGPDTGDPRTFSCFQ